MTTLWLALVVGCVGTTEDTGGTPELPDGEDVAPVAEAGPPRAVEVGEALVLDAAPSVGEQFSWTLGDGTVLEGPVITHRWASPGNYGVTLQVTGVDGTWRSDTTRVTVYEPLAPTVPSRSGWLARDDDGRWWAVLPEAGTVTVVEPDGELVAHLDACGGARSVSIAAGTAWVACEDDDTVVAFAVAALERVSSVPLGVGARPVAVLADAAGVDVALSGTGEVVRIEGGALDSRRDVADPRALALAPDGVRWTTRWRASDGEGSVDRAGETVVLSRAGGPDTDTSNRGVATLLEALTLSPSGTRALIGGVHANIEAGLWRDGVPLRFDTTVRGMVRLLDASSGDELVIQPLDDLDSVSAAAFDPLGTTAWLLHPGARHVSQIDVYTGDTLRGFETGHHHARDLAVTDDGDSLVIHAWLDRELVAWDVSVRGAPPAVRWRVSLVDEEPLSDEVLRGKQLFHDSWDTRLAQDAYQHCAICHPDGGQDGLVWDFTQRGEGLRNTTSLLGSAGLGHGRVHWTGNFDEIQDFEHDIRAGQGGTGLMDDATFDTVDEPLGTPKAGRSSDLDALAAYVGSLDVVPRSPHAAPSGGAAAFEAAGCAECHPAPTYTDSTLDAPVRHDVGTLTEASGQRLGAPLDGLDTPSLLGVQATSPWLHDGSAATLEEAIEAHVEGLDDQTLTRVADFVRSL